MVYHYNLFKGDAGRDPLPFLLAEAARSECAPSMRAMETIPAASLGTGKEYGNRSVDARSEGKSGCSRTSLKEKVNQRPPCFNHLLVCLVRFVCLAYVVSLVR